MPVYFDPGSYALVVAACERLIPADDAHPGAAAARRRRLRRRAARRVHLRPAPRSGPAARSPAASAATRVRRLPAAVAGSRSSRGAPASRGRRAIAEREFNGPVVGWQERYRDGLAALGADFVDRRPGGAGRPARRRPRLQAAPLRARVRGRVRRARVRRQPRPRRLAGHRVRRATCSPAATPTRRCRARA